MSSIDATRIPGLSDDDQQALSALHKQLAGKQARNQTRANYYDAKQAIRYISPTMPAVFQQLATVLGWPAKAVDLLANRCVLDEFVAPGLDVGSLGVAELWDDNQMPAESSQATTSALIHAVAWLIATKGAEGEPAALITARDALSGTGMWNRRTRRLDSFLSVIERNDEGQPVDLALYFPDRIVEARKSDGQWTVDRREHNLGRVPVEPVTFKPRLGRPFGASRVSRPVMAMTDMAMRTVLRSEVTAELYSIPQQLILGGDEAMFTDGNGNPRDAMAYVVGKVLGIPINEETGEAPEVVHTPQASQSPHMEQLRSLAMLFAGEASIPITSLGIAHDANPTSAEAYFASREDLIGLAETTTNQWSVPYQRTMLTALQLREGLDEIPADWRRIRARWRNPAHTSRAAQSDSAQKAITAMPWIADTDTALELWGFDDILIEQLRADRRRARASSTLQTLAAVAGNGDTGES